MAPDLDVRVDGSMLTGYDHVEIDVTVDEQGSSNKTPTPQASSGEGKTATHSVSVGDKDITVTVTTEKPTPAIVPVKEVEGNDPHLFPAVTLSAPTPVKASEVVVPAVAQTSSREQEADVPDWVAHGSQWNGAFRLSQADKARMAQVTSIMQQTTPKH